MGLNDGTQWAGLMMGKERCGCLDLIFLCSRKEIFKVETFILKCGINYLFIIFIYRFDGRLATERKST